MGCGLCPAEIFGDEGVGPTEKVAEQPKPLAQVLKRRRIFGTLAARVNSRPSRWTIQIFSTNFP